MSSQPVTGGRQKWLRTSSGPNSVIGIDSPLFIRRIDRRNWITECVCSRTPPLTVSIVAPHFIHRCARAVKVIASIRVNQGAVLMGIPWYSHNPGF